jgi:cation:H+ antiporter
MAVLLPVLAVVLGLAALVWSADRFVDGAAASARLLGVPALLVGMVVVGFGTSAPELTVSAVSSLRGNSSIALGNAWGSNICNIALILGVAAAIRPLAIRREALRFDLPILFGTTILAWYLLSDDTLSRADAVVLLAAFAAWLVSSCVLSLRKKRADAVEEDAPGAGLSGRMAAFWTVAGLVVLVVSSRVLVWGAVELAQALGVSDLVIGLTVVAVGTSLPELASSVAAARKGEDDLAVGNVIGSNLFNTLAVVGLAGAIRPMDAIAPAVYERDVPWAFCLTGILLLVLPFPCVCVKAGERRIERPGGLLLLVLYAAYLVKLVLAARP